MFNFLEIELFKFFIYKALKIHTIKYYLYTTTNKYMMNKFVHRISKIYSQFICNVYISDTMHHQLKVFYGTPPTDKPPTLCLCQTCMYR